MAVKIRLARRGQKHRPYFLVVVADERSPRDGAFIEEVGGYNPLVPQGDEKWLRLDGERITHWLAKGAQPSGSVKQLLKRGGVFSRAEV